ncbi:MAG: M24 family metallopeptidase [Myxococcales bacterium]|nr:M24 family metallopeptidase [Myxococcales bacterium]
MATVAAVHAGRRLALCAQVGAPVLLANNGVRVRNLPLNPLPFRADSTFLYYTGCTEPGAFALLVDGHCTLFLHPNEPGDELWHGPTPTLEQRRMRLGADAVRSVFELDAATAPHRGRLVGLAVPDAAVTARLAVIIGRGLAYPGTPGPEVLVDAVIRQRRTRDAWELDQMRLAATITAGAHRAAMVGTRPGVHERELAALFDAVIAARGGTTAYHSIVTVRGEVLHKPEYDQVLADGDLLLLDGGAEVPSGYASDVTRTWPVNGRFSGRQRAAYELVLAAQEVGIARCRVGTRYRDIHWEATTVLAAGLVELGLLRGSVGGLVESGATGVFFPHGVGHLIGLDVHDLENFGDRPAYAPGRSRPTQFGARFLRMDLDLEADMVVTVEPGFYVVPAILRDPELRERFADQVDFALAESWIGFGGIRIEDDVRVRPPTEAGGEPEVLSAAIPKTTGELEALVGRGPSAAERLSA